MAFLEIEIIHEYDMTNFAYSSGLKLYKVHILHELKPGNYSLHRKFANFILEQGDGFSEKIMFSDENHFH